MEIFKNILLVLDNLDEGKPLFKRVLGMAKSNQAKLTILDVVNLPARDLQVLKIYMDPEEFRDLVIQERLKVMKKFISSIGCEGVDITERVIVGTPFLEIIRQVLRYRHDLVMTAAEGEGGIKQMLFGTTPMHLIRKCPCPVWVMKVPIRRRFSRILAAVDPAPADKVRQSLNGKILEMASSIAQSESSQLHIVHAWRLSEENLLRESRAVPNDRVDLMVDETQKAHRSWLDSLLAEHSVDVPRERVHFLRGEPGILIPRFAKEKRIELIVMGSVGRTGVAGFLIGNTAEKVLQQIQCSVLTVKPEGYLSPIEIE